MRRMVTDAEIEKLGGTKLYKHVTSVIDNSEQEQTLVFITTSQQSLEDEDLYNLSGKYISGFIKYYSQYYGILGIRGNAEEPIIDYIDDSGNLTYIQASGIYLGTDTVEAL